jgi:uncharacterized membrane protein YgcG
LFNTLFYWCKKYNSEISGLNKVLEYKLQIIKSDTKSNALMFTKDRIILHTMVISTTAFVVFFIGLGLTQQVSAQGNLTSANITNATTAGGNTSGAGGATSPAGSGGGGGGTASGGTPSGSSSSGSGY